MQGESVNKLNNLTIVELEEALQVLKNTDGIKGLMLASNKSVFIVGADITEFGAIASQGETAILEMVNQVHSIINGYEDLPYPTVTAINGIALGGGLEMSLSTDYRVMVEGAKVGFPEVNLGIMPGWGGTVRAPRLIGADNGIEWVAGAKNYKASEALAVGMVDAVVSPEHLEEAALSLLTQAINGDIDYKKRRAQKIDPLKLDMIESIGFLLSTIIQVPPISSAPLCMVIFIISFLYS